MMQFKPVFIVGHPRSGSTLLAARLGQHSKLHSTPETHYFDLSYSGNLFQRWLACRNRERFERFVTAGNPRLEDLKISIDEIKEISRRQFPAFDSVLRVIMDREAALNGKERCVEKTPRHLEHVPLIIKWFPGAKIIAIIRDGRDAIRSLLNVSWTHNDLGRHAAHWSSNVAQCVEFAKRYPENFKLIRYEQLLIEPEATLRGVCEFIGEDFEQQMLSGTSTDAVIPEWEKNWKGNSGAAIDPALAQTWRRASDQKVIQEIAARIQKELTLAGYIDPGESAISVKRTSALRHAALRLRHDVNAIVKRNFVRRVAHRGVR